MAISIPEPSETGICSNDNNGETDHAIFSDKNEILNFANFFKTFFNFNFCSSKFINNLNFFQLDQIMSQNGSSHEVIDLICRLSPVFRSLNYFIKI
jgi:hypothetical protein